MKDAPVARMASTVPANRTATAGASPALGAGAVVATGAPASARAATRAPQDTDIATANATPHAHEARAANDVISAGNTTERTSGILEQYAELWTRDCPGTLD